DAAQRRLGNALTHQADALPGVFFQLADDLLGMRVLALDGGEAGPVEIAGDGEHHAGAHVVRPQAQGAVADRSVGEAELGHLSPPAAAGAANSRASLCSSIQRVLTWPARNSGSLTTERRNGIVVSIPCTSKTARARCMRASASARSAPC